MNKQTNAEYWGISSEQAEKVGCYMKLSRSQWPERLRDIAQANIVKHGACSEVLIDAIVQYLKEGPSNA